MDVYGPSRVEAVWCQRVTYSWFFALQNDHIILWP
jgi:hypothetical protein